MLALQPLPLSRILETTPLTGELRKEETLHLPEGKAPGLTPHGGSSSAQPCFVAAAQVLQIEDRVSAELLERLAKDSKVNDRLGQS